MNHLPLRPGSSGESVHDLQRRLVAVGYPTTDSPGDFASSTDDAVRRFQESRGLRADGVCGPQTWAALVEAGWRLGDRLLYLRSVMLRGDDVAELQRRLGSLGFDAGRVDGIFGVGTGRALSEFQRNSGLRPDGVCGPATIDALVRIAGREGPGPIVAAVREEEGLRDQPRRLGGRRVVVGENGGLAALAEAVGHSLSAAGAHVAVLHHPDDARQAAEANRYDAAAFVALTLRLDEGCQVAFYATEGFSSSGGAQLARCAVAELEPIFADKPSVKGMRLPVLRETRMPSVLCEFGPPPFVVEQSPAIARALGRAFAKWVETPLDDAL